jgi:hypothetical protein
MVIQPPELGCAVTDADFIILACNQWFQAWATAPVGQNLLTLFPGLDAHLVAATRNAGADKTWSWFSLHRDRGNCHRSFIFYCCLLAPPMTNGW